MSDFCDLGVEKPETGQASGFADVIIENQNPLTLFFSSVSDFSLLHAE